MAEKVKEDKHYDVNHKDDGRGASGDGMASRSCTDLLCLLIFFGFLSAMSYVTHYGLKNGNPKRLTHGYNYNGDLCGVDPGFEDRPFLYYCPDAVVQGIPTALNLKAPVCVSKCPTDPNETIKCMGQSQVTPVSVSPTSQVLSLAQSVKDTTSYATIPVLGMYCIPDLKKLNAIATASGVPVPMGLRDSLFKSSGPIGKASIQFQHHVGSLRRCWQLLCTTLVLSLVLGYCYLICLRLFAKPLIYAVLLTIIFACFAFSGFFLMGEIMPRPEPLGMPVPVSDATVVPAALTPTTPIPAAVTPITPTTPIPAAPPAVAPGAPVVVPAPIAPAPPVVVPVAPTGPIAPATNRRLVSVGSPAFRRLMSYEEACMRVPAACDTLDKRWANFGGRKRWEEANPFYNEHMSPKDAKTASQVAGCIWAAVGLIFLILLCCGASSINTACGVVKASCECLFAMPALLLMPAIEMVIKVVLIATMLVLFSFVVSSGQIDTKTYAHVEGQEINGLRRHFKYSDKEQGFIAFYVFGFFWLLELANAMGSFVISYAVVGWYYTPKTSSGGKGHNWFGIMWGYIYACTFHLGTLALGSFFVALFRYIRLILGVVEKQSQADGNIVVKCIARILICCITCFKKFIEFINKNAYIDVCITSNNFCGAAKDVMEFLATNGATIAILNGACLVFSFAGTVLIAGVTAYVTYTLTTSNKRWMDEASPHHVESPRFVAGVAFVGAAFIAHGFMAIFDHTADTLLYTYCWNLSKGHNTVQNYAPAGLVDLVEYKPIEKPKAAPATQGAAPAANGGGGFWSSLFGGGHSETSPLINKH